jgi:hypothetical protein
MKIFGAVVLAILISSAPLAAQDLRKMEIFGGVTLFHHVEGGYHFFHPIARNPVLLGWAASVTGNINRIFGITAEITGTYGSMLENRRSQSVTVDLSSYTFLAGPRVIARRKRLSLFGHFLFGMQHAQATDRAASGGMGNAATENVLIGAMGGGLDIHLGKRAALRVAQAEYTIGNFEGVSSSALRYAAGLVFKF